MAQKRIKTASLLCLTALVLIGMPGSQAKIACEDPFAGDDNLLNTNATCAGVRALNYALDSPQGGLISISGIENDQAVYRDNWDAGFTISLATDVHVPVDITVTPPVPELAGGADCFIESFEVTDGAGGAVGGQEQHKFRLYPHTYANLADQVGVGLSSQVFVKMEGIAPHADIQKQEIVYCNLLTAVAGVDLLGTVDSVSALNSIMAVPPAIDTLLMGAFVGVEDGSNGYVIATPSVSSQITFYGTADSWSMQVAAQATFSQLEDEQHDTDYMKVDFSVGGQAVIDREGTTIEKSVSFDLYPQATKTACAVGNVYDHEWTKYRPDVGGQGDSMCVILGYQKVEAVETPCLGPAQAVLEGRQPHAGSLQDCNSLLERAPDHFAKIGAMALAGHGTLIPMLANGQWGLTSAV